MRFASRFLLALLVPVLPAVVACGNGKSEADNGGSNDTHPHSLPAPDDGGAPDTGVPTPIEDGCGDGATSCTDPCGVPTAPVCVGHWVCPSYPAGGYDCALDGGGDAWAWISGDDAGDDAPTGDAWAPDSAPPAFSCGDVACDPQTSYCQIRTGGPVLDDGGVSSGFSCLPLPTGCGGTTPATCDCLQPWELLPPGCGCVATSGDVIVTCDVP